MQVNLQMHQIQEHFILQRLKYQKIESAADYLQTFIIINEAKPYLPIKL